MDMLVLLGIVLVGLLGIVLVGFIIVPAVLALIATIIRRCRSNTKERKEYKSTLYAGTVWHTRFLPKRHAFNYPIFMFGLDLEEIDTIMNYELWPLSWIMSFRNIDHLKNGEGLLKNKENDENMYNADNNSLVKRVLRLVAEKTNQKFVPTLDTHRVAIMTHLCYYGYNFNPVSFYYIIERATNTTNYKSNNDENIEQKERVSAIVGELSNTPWIEMYCHVLHDDSIDQVQIRREPEKEILNYFFPKVFHISPFMEMDYMYDWTFTGIPRSTTKGCDELTIVTSLRQKPKEKKDCNEGLRQQVEEKGTLQFTAKMVVETQGPITSPFRLAWHLIRFPVFCMIIQIWIHYEAALLFIKGIVYIPHPNGTESEASRIIGTAMIPFFAIRDYFASPKHHTKQS